MKASGDQEYVVDANVLFGAFISGKDFYQLLFSGHTVYLPDFALAEVEKYKDRILRKTKLPEHELQRFVLALLAEVIVVPGLVLSRDSRRQAYELCRDLDEKDTLYVATAIELNASLVTSDKTLLGGLGERGFTQVVLLSDLVAKLTAPG